MQHQFPGAPASGTQKSLHLQRALERRAGDQSRLHVEGDGGDFGVHLSVRSGFGQLGIVAQAELDHRDARGRMPQGADLGQPAVDPDLIQAAGASAGFASGTRSIIERDFSSFIIGEGAVTALAILMMR